MPEMTLILPRAIAQRADETPDRTFIQEIGGRQQSFAEFQGDCRRWIAALQENDVGSHDTVATMIPAGLETYHCWMALGWLRAIEVPVNHEYGGQMLAFILNNSEARLMVASTRFLDQILAVADDLRHLETVIVLDAAELPPATPLRLVAGIDAASGAEPRLEQLEHWDTAGVMYTSGTTGTSKGVICSWAHIGSAPGGVFPQDERFDDGAYYSPWQPYHLTGRTALQIAVQMGLRLVIRERFSVTSWWDDVREYRCTHALCAFLGSWMWNQPPTDSDADNPLERLAMAPLIKEFREFEKRFGLKVFTSYASVEAGFAIEPAHAPADHRICGRARDGYEVRTVDEHDEEVPVGEKGELIIRSDRPWRTFGGYFNDPAATATVWRNGWVHTGDAFTRDEAGNLYFVDRLKDYIKYRGQTVSTAEVEAAVVAHPDVVECACVGVPSDLAVEGVVGGDDIRVFVVTNGTVLPPDELAGFLSDRMPRFMVPRYIDLVENLPKNHVNKVVKNDLRALPVSEGTWDRERVAEPR